MTNLRKTLGIAVAVVGLVVAATGAFGSVPLSKKPVEGITLAGHTVTFDEAAWGVKLTEGKLEIKWKKPKPAPISGLTCECASGGQGGSCNWTQSGNKATCNGTCGGDACVIGAIWVEPKDL